jgi:hypothetical protein
VEEHELGVKPGEERAKAVQFVMADQGDRKCLRALLPAKSKGNLAKSTYSLVAKCQEPPYS